MRVTRERQEKRWKIKCAKLRKDERSWEWKSCSSEGGLLSLQFFVEKKFVGRALGLKNIWMGYC